MAGDIGIALIERGSTIRTQDSGTLVLARWRAQELGLLDGSAP